MNCDIWNDHGKKLKQVGSDDCDILDNDVILVNWDTGTGSSYPGINEGNS
jgi:hypothetical protein